jgi:hypothetical protein
MSIHPFVAHEAFDPELIETMAAAFDHACARLGLADREDAITEIVARRIVVLARSGIHTKTALYLRTIQDFKAKARPQAENKKLVAVAGRLQRS